MPENLSDVFRLFERETSNLWINDFFRSTGVQNRNGRVFSEEVIDKIVNANKIKKSPNVWALTTDMFYEEPRKNN